MKLATLWAGLSARSPCLHLFCPSARNFGSVVLTLATLCSGCGSSLLRDEVVDEHTHSPHTDTHTHSAHTSPPRAQPYVSHVSLLFYSWQRTVKFKVAISPVWILALKSWNLWGNRLHIDFSFYKQPPEPQIWLATVLSNFWTANKKFLATFVNFANFCLFSIHLSITFIKQIYICFQAILFSKRKCMKFQKNHTHHTVP